MRRSRKHVLGHAVWSLSAVVVAVVTITPLADDPSTMERICLVCGEFGVIDAGWNFGLFLPLGLGLAMVGVRASRAFAGMLAATVAIEVLQITVVGGRDASLGDVIWNTSGGMAGWVLGSRVESLLFPGRRASLTLTICALALWLVGCLSVPWALQRDPTESEYIGQLGHALGGLPPYPGRVLASTVGGLSIADAAIEHSSSVRRALLHPAGADIEARVLPATTKDRDASIVRIVDHQRREIFELSAREADLRFSLRTRAARLRLRTLHFRLLQALEEGPDARVDTVSIAARYVEDRVELKATSRAATRRSTIPLTASIGWRLVSPLPIETDGTFRDTLLNACWLFALATPMSYWLSFVAILRHRRVMLVIAAMTLIVGLAAGPYAFRIAPPSVADFAGITAGLAAGSLLATLVKRRLSVGAPESL